MLKLGEIVLAVGERKERKKKMACRSLHICWHKKETCDW